MAGWTTTFAFGSGYPAKVTVPRTEPVVSSARAVAAREVASPVIIIRAKRGRPIRQGSSQRWAKPYQGHGHPLQAS
jgi:hypothetical protein